MANISNESLFRKNGGVCLFVQSAYLSINVEQLIRRGKNDKMSLLNSELKRLTSKQGIKFKTGFLNLGAKKLMTPNVFLIMRNQNNIWKIDYKLYDTYQVDKIFEFMTENNAEIILFNDNCRPTIIKEMRNVYFHELKELNLSKNNLASIQSLSQLQIPKLNKLDLSQNQLTIIRSMNRLINNITSLKISENPIMDVERLKKCSFYELEELELQTKSKQPVIGQSLIWLITFPSNKLSELRCASRRRIKQPWLYPQLAQKYPKGRIALH